MIALRPSAAGKWFNCTGSPKMEEGRPEGDTTAADEGTVAHWIAAKILNNEELPKLGTTWEIDENRKVQPAIADTDNPIITYDQDMLDHVRKYTDAVSCFSIYHVEESVGLSDLLGYPEADGTPDCVSFSIVESGQEIQIHDLKYGYNEVEAENNLQLLCYAYGDYEYRSVNQMQPAQYRLMIHQPRLNLVNDVVYTISELREKWQAIKERARQIQSGETSLNAREHCSKHYCKAQAVCPALSDYVLEMLPDEVKPGQDISSKLERIPVIRKWCDAVEAEAYELAVEKAIPIPGFKVVEGRQGNRQWSSKEDAEATLKSIRLKHDQMYKYDVISPTTAEKLYKEGVIGKRQWPKLVELITRSDSKLQLVPESDKRKAVEVKSELGMLPDDFSDLIGE